jgi:Fe-S cluster biogenesis protein NfuA
VERFTDPAAQASARELVQVVLDLHGLGLERIFEHLEAAGEAGAAARDRCARDEVVGGLLLLHGLHPLGVEDRVLQALEQVRPYLHSHGGNVELLGVDGAVVRLRLEGSCHGCPSSAVTMKQTIEESIFGLAPELSSVVVEGSTEGPPTTPDGRPLVVLSAL